MKEYKLLSWNVNGIRAARKKGFLEWLGSASPDILCVQETKAQPEQLDDETKDPPGYRTFWNWPERKGYSGVAIYTRKEPLDVRYDLGAVDIEIEGRVIVAEYPGFTLFNIYYPNGSRSPERLAYKMKFYDEFLEYADSLRESGKQLIICGDVNTAHKEIDLARPKENSNKSGFLPEERAWIDKFISHGYADTFRHFNEGPDNYTYWDMKTRARDRNVGWRIDYFFVNDGLLPAVTGAFIMPEVMGSDHCPLGITLKTD